MCTSGKFAHIHTCRCLATWFKLYVTLFLWMKWWTDLADKETNSVSCISCYSNNYKDDLCCYDAPLWILPITKLCPALTCFLLLSCSFKSRKCGDAFAEALGRSLPTMGSLKMLGWAKTCKQDTQEGCLAHFSLLSSVQTPVQPPTPSPFIYHFCLPFRLTGSKITARGISHLVQALPLCSQLEELR